MKKFNHAARRWCVKQARRLGIECTTATVDIARGARGQVVLTNYGKEVGAFCLDLLVERDSEGVKRELTCYDCGALLIGDDMMQRWSDVRETNDGRHRVIRVMLCEGCAKNMRENETRRDQ